MAVPNNDTFEMQDVRTELGLPFNTSLLTAFSAADNAKFDPAYSGLKNSLLNFRNYGFSSGDPNTLVVSPMDVDVTVFAGSFEIDVVSNTTWLVDGESWITVDPPNGAGNGTVIATYTANPSFDPRTGFVTIQTSTGSPLITRAVNVTQEGV